MYAQIHDLHLLINDNKPPSYSELHGDRQNKNHPPYIAPGVLYGFVRVPKIFQHVNVLADLDHDGQYHEHLEQLCLSDYL